MKTNSRKFRLLKDKELRNKFLADQIKIGLRYQLRSIRDAQGLTQKDLADLIGTKQSVISRLEKIPERVSIPTLLDIAEALDVGVVVRFEEIDTILEWYGEQNQKKMTPRKSEKVLTEFESKPNILNDEIIKENNFNKSTPMQTITTFELDKEAKKNTIVEELKTGRYKRFLEADLGIFIPSQSDTIEIEDKSEPSFYLPRLQDLTDTRPS